MNAPALLRGSSLREICGSSFMPQIVGEGPKTFVKLRFGKLEQKPIRQRLFSSHDTRVRPAAASLGVVFPIHRHSKESTALLRIGLQPCQLPTGDSLFETEPTTLKVCALVHLHGRYPQLCARLAPIG